MKIIVTVLIAAQVLGAANLRVATDLAAPHVVYRCLIGRVERQEFETMASDFLRSEEIRLGVLAIYGTDGQRFVAGSTGADEGSYDHARRMVTSYDVSRNGCPEVQQAVKFRSSILLRWMDRNCRSGKRLLQGSIDPLEMVVDGRPVELLEFVISRSIVEEPQSVNHVGFFARTNGPPTISVAKAAATQIKLWTGIRMQDLAGVGSISFALRSDSWFYNFAGFPALFPFSGRPEFPTAEQFEATREVYCAEFATVPLSCWEGPAGPSNPGALRHKQRWLPESRGPGTTE